MNQNVKAKKVTVYDVAKLADTSATTVSRVLNNVDYPVKEALRQRIFSSIKELNYSPNALARSLKSSTSKNIGVVIPTISNIFYSSVILGIEKEVSRYDYNVLLCNTFRDTEKERKYFQSLYENQVKGVVLSSMGNTDLKSYIEKGMHFVLLDQKIEDINCSLVNVDCFKGTFMAVEHLIKNGHKKIAFISSPLTRWTRKQSFKGYKAALEQYDIQLKEEYLLISEDDEKELYEEGFEFIIGKKQGEIFLRNKLDATAVMAVNDMVAFGFMQELHSAGKKIPDDVSLVGFDDITFASMFSPALTTVKYPANEVGKLAGKLIIDQIQGFNTSEISLNLEPKLVIRDTVKSLV